MLEAGILSVIVAIIRRGSIMWLADLKVERVWLVFMPAVMIVASVIVRQNALTEIWVPVTGGLHVLYQLAFLALFWSNRQLAGIKWLIAGWVLNFIPIIANGGKMPVSEWAAKVANAHDVQMSMAHMVMSSVTRFNWLADIIPGPRPPLFITGPAVWSIGDVLMAVGIFVLIQLTMCPRKSKCAVCEV